LTVTASTLHPVAFVFVVVVVIAAADDDDTAREIGGFNGFEYEHNALMRHDPLQFVA
jgi:hypothetical protein